MLAVDSEVLAQGRRGETGLRERGAGDIISVGGEKAGENFLSAGRTLDSEGGARESARESARGDGWGAGEGSQCYRG